MEEGIKFQYQGKSIEELKNMKVEEFAKLIPSRDRRKILRGFTEQEKKLLEKFNKQEKNIKTHCRDMVVIPQMIGQRISIYNGKEYVQVNIIGEMLGHRLGEFAMSRKIAKHTSGAADNKKKKKKSSSSEDKKEDKKEDTKEEKKEEVKK